MSNHFYNMVTGNTETDAPNEPTSDAINQSHDDNVDNFSAEQEANNTVDPQGDTTSSTTSDLMPENAKRVLVHLMRHGVIFHAQKPNLYTELCQHQVPIRRHLSEVYLNLVLDERQGVAFIARPDSDMTHNAINNTDANISGINKIQNGKLASELDIETGIEADDDNTPSLITKRTLSLYDTLILLVLRKYYQEREASGEQKIIIDIERLSSLLTPFLPLTDHASKDQKKLVARLKELSRRHLLTSVRGTDERYEITPLIRYVVNADFLESMLGEYMRLVKETTGDNFEDDIDDDDNMDDVDDNIAKNTKSDLQNNDNRNSPNKNNQDKNIENNDNPKHTLPDDPQADLFG
ncbi:DUF4194 domain-containing protein [Psychrobacter lutiphocae]|uniref:DUF4194 domain-containing protein n=1 Tax=Psychrobacter lutiphocae TaxID=540500 RepID=UPI0003757A30|nr:DUF4194 domain-containing protein [Psychrobacter lutiphocae]